MFDKSQVLLTSRQIKIAERVARICYQCSVSKGFDGDFSDYTREYDDDTFLIQELIWFECCLPAHHYSCPYELERTMLIAAFDRCEDDVEEEVA